MSASRKNKAVQGEEWRTMDGGPSGRRAASADAAIVRRARRGIREHRMRDVMLRFVDRRGQPLAGRTVEIELLRHDFPFGDQVWPLDALAREGRWESERARAWRRRFAEVFNASTNLCYWTEAPRNDASKTEDQQGEPRVENFAQTVDWSNSAGLTAKGHPLFWSIPKCTPEWVKRYDTATFMKFAEVRVRNLVARFRGRVRLWDAVNEPMWEAAPKNLARRVWPHIESTADIAAYIAPVMRWCREEDPDALYLVNDYGMECDFENALTGTDGARVTAATQRRRFLALIRALQDAGAAPDAIGLQSHTGGWQSHAGQWAMYDEFAASGLPVHVTEFWAETKRLEAAGTHTATEIAQMQADYVADYLTCAFGHANVEGFFFWGFMGTAIHWRDEHASHDLNPVFERVRRLIHEEWHTRERLTTAADGTLRYRGFLGEYAARLVTPEARRGQRFTVTRGTGMPVALTVCV